MFCHARMFLSCIHDFRQLQTGFPPRNVAGMTELGVLQLARNIKVSIYLAEKVCYIKGK